jgi:hypothetical protein
MTMNSWSKVSMAVAALALGGMGCAAESMEDPNIEQDELEYVSTQNGIQVVNGLRTRNGMRARNGLSTENGLRARNGATVINGMRTRNGVRTRNGLDTDCTGKTLGVDCDGEPDGLFSRATGLMSDEEGKQTAAYIVKCALPAGEAVTVLDYAGNLVQMQGQLGLAPSFGDDYCDTTCEEKVSACLIALTNGKGQHVNLEISAQFANADGIAGTADDVIKTLGVGHSSDFPKQEIIAYGNLFANPPEAHFCSGDGITSYANSWMSILSMDSYVGSRLCGGQSGWDCLTAYKYAGICNKMSFSGLTPNNKCSFPTTPGRWPWSDSIKSDTAASCKDKSGKTWNNPITSFVGNTSRW